METTEWKCKQITDTKLWKHLTEKSRELADGHAFVDAVADICAVGLNVSKDIIRFFPNFTLHDGVHSRNVIEWMWVLLGDRAKELTICETALLLMSACCHDIGMAVSKDQEKKLRQSTFRDWEKHFDTNKDDAEKYYKTEVISDRMICNYVRQNHHLLVENHLIKVQWPPMLTFYKIKLDALVVLCESHGTSLFLDKLTSHDEYDLLMCAVLLRLADLLDYDAERAPEILFQHMGLDNPESAEEVRSAAEHQKNRIGGFNSTIKDGVLDYRAIFKDLQQEMDVRKYLDMVMQEMDYCSTKLGQTASAWKNLELPHKISTSGAGRDGYTYGEFCMTMDQDKIIQLLTGKNIYTDPGVFVRELVQNSIDAVLMRSKQEKDFKLDQGRIIIDTWPADDGDTWFRIRDNGIGMDENIILNYFLMVGRSYYTSDEFLAANRKAHSGAYTPISRFGIGLLSCFMEDQKDTELKVSTKWFRGNGDDGIRLDVTGLHGYYYLAHEEHHWDGAASFLKMPVPDDDDENSGYRSEPGTTICVKTNMFRMGRMISFRDILDKYVQFPEVRVEYHDAQEHKVYPTQQELMDAVYALNPGGEVKTYFHELSGEYAEAFKNAFPIIKWKNPKFNMRYYPFNKLSDSDNMTGVAMTMEVLNPWKLQEGYHRVLKDIKYEFVWSLSVEDTLILTLQLSLPDSNSAEVRNLPDWVTSPRSYRFPVEFRDLFLTEPEQKVYDLVTNSLRCAKAKNNQITYNGVLVAGGDPIPARNGGKTGCTVLLLRDSFLPEVNVARSRILHLPLEAACRLTVASHILDPKCGSSADMLAKDAKRLLTERELWEVLKDYPQCADLLKTVWRPNPRGSELVYDGKLIESLSLCAEKHNHAVYHPFDEQNRFVRCFTSSEAPADKRTADFPVGMFASPTAQDGALAHITWRNVFYNREHIFSRWLIEHHIELEKKVRVMYSTLIRVMVLGRDKEEICNTVNTILRRLSTLEDNCFGIHDGLYLADSDFISEK